MTDAAKTAALGTVLETLLPGTGWGPTNGIAWKMRADPFADPSQLFPSIHHQRICSPFLAMEAIIHDNPISEGLDALRGINT